MFRTNRIFTDYKQLKETDSPGFKALAKALQWLYDEEIFEDCGWVDVVDLHRKDEEEMDEWITRNHNFCMKGHGLYLYDLMNLVLAFVTCAKSDFPSAEVGNAIEGCEEGQNLFDIDDAGPEVRVVDGVLCVRRLYKWTTATVLWAAYIWCLFQTDLNPQDGDWVEARDLLYKRFCKQTGLKEAAVKRTILMQRRNETIVTLLKNLPTSGAPEEAPADSHPDARVSELKAENKRLTEEVEELRELLQQGAEQITCASSVRLALTLRLLKDEGLDVEKHGNKVRAARILSAITGLQQQTCQNYLANPTQKTSKHDEEKLRINSELQALGINILL